MNRRIFTKNLSLITSGWLLPDSTVLNLGREKGVSFHIQQFMGAIGAYHGGSATRMQVDEVDGTVLKTDRLDVFNKANLTMRAYYLKTDYLNWDLARLLIYNAKTETFITSFDEASVIGASKAAVDLYVESSSETTFNAMTPILYGRKSIGSLYNGYEQSLQYNSSNAAVEIDVKKKKGNERLVKVIASSGYNRLIDKEYKIEVA